MGGPAYRLETPRLVVRCWDPRDAPLLAAALHGARAHLAPWFDWARDEPRDLAERVLLLRQLRARFDLDQERAHALLDPGERQVLGGVDLHAADGDDARQLGFWLAPAALGRGLASEAVSALVRAAFEIDGLARLEIRCDAHNLRARALAARLRFRPVADAGARSALTAPVALEPCVHVLLRAEHAGAPAARLPVRAFDAAGGALELRAPA